MKKDRFVQKFRFYVRLIGVEDPNRANGCLYVKHEDGPRGDYVTIGYPQEFGVEPRLDLFDRGIHDSPVHIYSWRPKEGDGVIDIRRYRFSYSLAESYTLGFDSMDSGHPVEEIKLWHPPEVQVDDFIYNPSSGEIEREDWERDGSPDHFIDMISNEKGGPNDRHTS